MKALAALAPLLIATAGAASAQTAWDHEQGASGYAFEHPHVFDAWGRPTPPRQLYRSGNECGPDHPVPVWGPGNALQGYACEGESANGS